MCIVRKLSNATFLCLCVCYLATREPLNRISFPYRYILGQVLSYVWLKLILMEPSGEDKCATRQGKSRKRTGNRMRCENYKG